MLVLWVLQQVTEQVLRLQAGQVYLDGAEQMTQIFSIEISGIIGEGSSFCFFEKGDAYGLELLDLEELFFGYFAVFGIGEGVGEVAHFEGVGLSL